MSHIQHKYQTRDDFKLLYSNIKHKMEVFKYNVKQN